MKYNVFLEFTKDRNKKKSSLIPVKRVRRTFEISSLSQEFSFRVGFNPEFCTGLYLRRQVWQLKISHAAAPDLEIKCEYAYINLA